MPKIRRILCPIDLSEISRHALDHALAIAEWHGARVTILHVYAAQPLLIPSPVGASEFGMPPAVPTREELASSIRDFTGVGTRIDADHADVLIVEGAPTKEILAEVDRSSPDLLVMGTHGRTGVGALLLGSVTESVLRRTRLPVLTVPPPVKKVESVAYRTILCPIEFSDASTRALEYAVTLAEENGSRLLLLHVLDYPSDAGERNPVGQFTVANRAELEEAALARLRRAVPDAVRDWCMPEELVLTGEIDTTILEVADREHAELIVMGVNAKNPLTQRLVGSTTNRVIREARCPVLTLLE